MNICIIPARGNSQRIPRKNIKKFHGKPIIQYSIETAEKSGLFDEIIVSTDDDEIAEIASDCGATAYRRADELSIDSIGTQIIAKDVLTSINVGRFKYACVVYATSPLMTVEDLRRGLTLLNTSRRLNFSYSIGPDGKDAGQFYWGRYYAFINEEPLHMDSVPASNTITVPIDESRVCDINTENDWITAEKKYARIAHR